MGKYDFNDAGPQREFGGEPMPDGTYVWLVGRIKKGGASHPNDPPGDPDIGLYTKSGKSDALGLAWEYEVQHGQYKGRKVFDNFMTVHGGQVDENGRSKGGAISRTTLRAMVDSAMGLKPDDESAEAKAKRVVNCMAFFDGIPFGARLGVEEGGSDGKGGKYPDKNFLAHVVLSGEPEYEPLKAGQDVPPKPSGIRRAPGATGNPAAAVPPGTPAWAASAAPSYAPAPGPVVAPRWGSVEAASAPVQPETGAGQAMPSWVR